MGVVEEQRWQHHGTGKVEGGAGAGAGMGMADEGGGGTTTSKGVWRHERGCEGPRRHR